MGTQGPGRKRIPNREKLVAEDDALNQIAREAEARLAAKRAARAEARDIRMKELERQQKEVSDDEERMSVGSRGSLRVEDRMDREFPDKGSRTASTLSAATLASLGGASSRRGSCDTSFSVETEASIRDIKDSLAEAEDKYRKAMVSNAQLHNEKLTLIYQVDTLREELSDMEELLWEARRQQEERSKELERERQTHTVLQAQFKEMRETLRRTEELLTEVSDLRVKSSSYCREVSDLQEALQWKDKKIVALERQRETSDIVRIERDRLRDEAAQLRDLLKEHGVAVAPEISTNGTVGQDEPDDDVAAQSASRLAQESSRGGRENLLGHVQEQPAGGSNPLEDDHCCVVPTERDTVKEKPEGTEQQAIRREERAEDPSRKLQIRQSRALLFRMVEEKTEPLTDELVATAQTHESECDAPQEAQDVEIYSEEAATDTVGIQEKTQGSSTDCKEQKKTAASSLVSSFVPVETLKDWTGLEKAFHGILKGLVEYQDLVTKLSKMVPEIPCPLNWCIRELEDKLKTIAGSVLSQCDGAAGLKRGSAGGEPPLRDSSDSRSKVDDVETTEKFKEKRSVRSPTSCPEVSVRSYFGEAGKTGTVEPETDQGLMVDVVEDQAEGRSLLGTDPSSSTKPQVDQGSEVSAGGAVSFHVSLTTLQEEKSREDGPVEKTPGGKAKDCEAADEDVKVCPVVKHNRKDKYKHQCKTS